MMTASVAVQNALCAGTIGRFFQVLADPTRVRVLEILLTGEKNVGELVDIVGLQQGRMSSHLACLRRCGFVSTRREGKYVFYLITDQRVRELMLLARAMLADHAGAIAGCTCCNPAAEADDDYA